MSEERVKNRTFAGGGAMAAAVVGAWVLREFAGIVPPPEVTAAASVLIGTIVQGIYSIVVKA